MVFQFLTSLIMDIFVWPFHDDADPRIGKSLLWFWQQALRCECPAVQGSYHSSVTQWKWKANKGHTKSICLWFVHLLVLEEATDHLPLPRTPHHRCAWLETTCNTQNQWYQGVKKSQISFKSITLNAATVQQIPQFFQCHQPPSGPCGRGNRGWEAATVTLLSPVP